MATEKNLNDAANNFAEEYSHGDIATAQSLHFGYSHGVEEALEDFAIWLCESDDAPESLERMTAKELLTIYNAREAK